MIDDHDRCEWVNVSSGTCSPGCHGQNPESHIGCVCTAVLCNIGVKNSNFVHIPNVTV